MLAPLLGCAAAGEPRTIRDIQMLKQDCLAYVATEAADSPLVAPAVQQAWHQGFRRQFFAPWHRDISNQARQDAAGLLAKYAKDPGFGENGRRHSAEWVGQLRELAGLDRAAEGEHARDAPARLKLPRRAITLANANLRDLPTIRPRFQDYYSLADGYPFDTLQNSAIWAGTPLLVCHVSPDGAWALVDCGFASGWLSIRELGWVDDELARRWEGSQLMAIVADGVSVRDAQDQTWRFAGHIGMVLPAADEQATAVLAPVAGTDGSASAAPAGLPQGSIVVLPCPLTPRNLCRIANRMLGQPYGWGGVYEDRDCSSTIRDLFIPFGRLLPRNSAQQASTGQVIRLTHLPPAGRERAILERGLPLLSLVRIPGHILLYVGKASLPGQKQERAVVLHTSWGVKVRLANGSEGRNVVGQCALTTLAWGDELEGVIRPGGDLRSRIQSLVLLSK